MGRGPRPRRLVSVPDTRPRLWRMCRSIVGLAKPGSWRQRDRGGVGSKLPSSCPARRLVNCPIQGGRLYGRASCHCYM